MMTFTIIVDTLLILAGLSMLLLGKYGVTRQLALLPALVAALDLAFVTKVQFALTPMLSTLLVILQVAVLCGSALVLREDRARARKKENRRRRRREMARTRAAFEQAAAMDRRRTMGACA